MLNGYVTVAMTWDKITRVLLLPVSGSVLIYYGVTFALPVTSNW